MLHSPAGVAYPQSPVFGTLGDIVQDLNDLYYFAQVVEHQGFAPAGRALGIPKSKLSRRIAVLEERLGVRLLQRSTRKFSVTELGQNYYQHCKAMLVEAEAAQEAIDLTRAEPQGNVRIASPVALLHFQVGGMLSDLVMKVLGESKQCLVASPSLLARHAPLRVPADLNGLPSLDLGRPQREHAWRFDGPEGAAAVVPHTPRLVTDDMMALRQAALAGVGVVQLPTMTIREEIRTGSIVHVLSDWVPRAGVVHAVFPSRRGMLPALRQFIDFLAVQFERLEEGD